MKLALAASFSCSLSTAAEPRARSAAARAAGVASAPVLPPSAPRSNLCTHLSQCLQSTVGQASWGAGAEGEADGPRCFSESGRRRQPGQPLGAASARTRARAFACACVHED